MELGFSCFSSILAFLLFSFMLLKLGKRLKSNKTTSNLPPGPWKLPIIGNLHQLIGSLPHRGLRDLANIYGPLMHLQLGEVSTIVVSSPEFAKEVMKTHDVIFASRPHNPGAKVTSYDDDTIFSPYSDCWKQLRKICVSELLSAKRVQSFRSVREEEVSNLIRWISSKGGSVINLTECLFSLMYGIGSRAAFGSKSRDQEAFVSVMAETMKVLAGFNIADLFPSIGLLQTITGFRSLVERLHQEADSVIENIINDHKKRRATSKIGASEENEDLIDVLLRIQDQGDGLELTLSTDNIKAVISKIFGAGGETSATTADWAMCEMTKNPSVMRKAQAEVRKIFNRKGEVDETSIEEMKFLKLVVKETFRLHPAGPLLTPRECREKCEIHGFDIPLKARVIVNAWAIGRDPNYWTDPDSFIPERFLDHPVNYNGTNYEFIPFGSGRMACPGISFGLANVEFSLAMLLYHFDWKLPDGMNHEDLDMSESYGLTVRRKKDLSMIPFPYYPSSVA